MRSFADTLPTLREGAASVSPTLGTDERFDPNVIVRVLNAPEATVRAAATLDLAGPLPAAPAETGARGLVPPFVRAAAKASARPSPIPPLDGPAERLEDRIEAAVAQARSEAKAAQAAAVERARAEERAAAQQALAAARRTWCEEEGSAFRERCVAGFEALHDRLSHAFARALTPVFDAAIRDVAVRAFSETLQQIAGPTAWQACLTVRGPADLIDALRQASGDLTVAFEVNEAATELAVTVDETLLETAVATWTRTLANTMGLDDDGHE
ncbi:hypothetical protein [Acuticoccus sp.]|uniref:hypothetical protein n=1 Tax=Acuticoccus sp. TaxID=1904378 RepID=UPI003B51C8ED